MKPTWGSERSSRNVARLWGYRAYEEDRERIRLWPGRPIAKPGSYFLSRCNHRFSKYFSNLDDRFSVSRLERLLRCSVVHSDFSSTNSLLHYAHSTNQNYVCHNSFATVAFASRLAVQVSWTRRSRFRHPR